MDVWRSIILKNLNLFAEGLWVTTQICVIAFFVACALGLGACLLRLYVRPLRLPATVYIEFCRNTPIYVQLLWVNYVWPDLFGWPQSFSPPDGWRWLCNPVDISPRPFGPGSRAWIAAICRPPTPSACRHS